MGAKLQSAAVTETPHPTPPQSGAPAEVAHPKVIKSYVRRAGRTTTGQAKALEELGPRYVLDYRPALLDAPAAFGRSAPLILEIGFGMGDATAHIAGLRAGDNFLCCEVHEPGVGALLKRIGEQGLENIRILQHDAVVCSTTCWRPPAWMACTSSFPTPGTRSATTSAA